MNVDKPENNDNRNYNYDGHGLYVRAEFPLISDWVKEGSKIIDLGCGNGSLIKYILERKNIDAEGIETSESGVASCLKNGLKARIGKIDKRDVYREYGNNQFDYAVCNVTLQMVMYPEVLLEEMRRISRFQIISFPNFAYIMNRLDLLFNGRMPRPMLHRYQWYNTGHIHQLSLKDFENYCGLSKVKILAIKHLGCLKYMANLFLPNLFSKESVYLCQKSEI